MSRYDEMWDAILTPVAMLLTIGALLAVLAAFSLLAFLLWMLITGIITLVRYHVYKGQLEADFEEELNSLGWNFDTDDVFTVAFGTNQLSQGQRSHFDWISGVVLGEEDDDDAA